jgi:hypothetical protein
MNINTTGGMNLKIIFVRLEETEVYKIREGTRDELLARSLDAAAP